MHLIILIIKEKKIVGRGQKKIVVIINIVGYRDITVKDKVNNRSD